MVLARVLSTGTARLERISGNRQNNGCYYRGLLGCDFRTIIDTFSQWFSQGHCMPMGPMRKCHARATPDTARSSPRPMPRPPRPGGNSPMHAARTIPPMDIFSQNPTRKRGDPVPPQPTPIARKAAWQPGVSRPGSLPAASRRRRGPLHPGPRGAQTLRARRPIARGCCTTIDAGDPSLPRAACVETKADYGRPARPKRLIGRGWPKLTALGQPEAAWSARSSLR